MLFVVDSSVTAAWCFPDEAHAVADAAFDRLTTDEAVVPALWWYEVRNLMVVNERRGRIETSDTAAFLVDVESLPIRIDFEQSAELLLALARAYGLTVYDAAYLELARRNRAPLATLDRALAAAARADGVALIEAV